MISDLLRQAEENPIPNILYHISNDMSAFNTEKLFIPRVPSSTGTGEDCCYRRICTADSIEHCMQAVPGRSAYCCVGARFCLYEFNTSEVGYENIMTPEDLEPYVPDAEVNQEYWITCAATAHGSVIEINNLLYEYCLNWSSINVAEFYNVMEASFCCDVFKKFMSYTKSPESIYNDIVGYYHARKEYELEEKVYDEVCGISWIRGIKINDVKYIKV